MRKPQTNQYGGSSSTAKSGPTCGRTTEDSLPSAKNKTKKLAVWFHLYKSPLQNTRRLKDEYASYVCKVYAISFTLV